MQDVPEDITLTCDEATVFVPGTLDYSNGLSGVCEISGSVPGFLDGAYNSCGGTQTVTWSFTDSCNNSLSYVQNISIDPAPPASFINPPADITLTCDEATVFDPVTLDYSNGLSGTCEISGSVPGILSGTFNTCGGAQMVTWSFTDSCNNLIAI